MRCVSRARWPSCAVVALICLSSTVLADTRTRVTDCTRFEQRDRESEDGVDFTVSSTCAPRLSCSIRWTLTCAPGTRRAARHRGRSTFELEEGASHQATASALACGGEGWEISDIQWRCAPTP